MKKFIALFMVVILTVLPAVPVLAVGLTISPPTVEFDVPSEGSTEIEFLVYDFTGDLQISLENIPLRVEPTTVSVTAKEEGTKVVLTFYGDGSLGSKIYEGKIRFLAMTGGTVAMGIKIRATVTNLVEGKEPVLATAGEFQLPPEKVSVLPEEEPAEETAPAPPSPAGHPAPAHSTTPGITGWPILPLAGIAAATAIVITLILVLVRRLRD